VQWRLWLICGVMLAQESVRIDWRLGPAVVGIGEGAELMVGAGLVLAEGEQARRFLEATGNPVVGYERAVVGAQGLEWFAVIGWRRFEELGFSLREPSAEEIARALLAGSAAANAARERAGRDTLEVTGWRERPRIDRRTGRLEWSLHTQESGGRAVANRFVYYVARSGVVEVELVTEEANAKRAAAAFEVLLQGMRIEREAEVLWDWLGAAAVLILAAAAAVLWRIRRQRG
jgi:uncharacterized membrane-anchored protein